MPCSHKKLVSALALLGVGLLPQAGLASELKSAVPKSAIKSWTPVFRFDTDLYPAYIVSTAVLKTAPRSARDQSSERLRNSLWVDVETTAPDQTVKVEVTIEGYAKPGVFTTKLGRPGKYTLWPTMPWNYEKLAALSQPVTANVIFTVWAQGVQVGHKTVPTRIRSISEAPLQLCKHGEKCENYGWVLAGFVNEDHPQVDQILSEALNSPSRIVERFNGYHRGEQNVDEQVFAIWNTLQRKGFNYSSIDTTSASRAVVKSQHVRFLEESLKTHEANCVDGSILFAAILRKIGIEPTLIWVPGHMYLGYALNKERTRYAYLETTMLGSGNPYKGRHPASDSSTTEIRANVNRSRKSFYAALNHGSQEFHKFKAGTPGYSTVDIKQARAMGVSTIGH